MFAPQVDINNPASYKPCAKKLFKYYVRKLEKGSLVFTKEGSKYGKPSKLVFSPKEELSSRDRQAFEKCKGYSGLVLDTIYGNEYLVFDPLLETSYTLEFYKVCCLFNAYVNGQAYSFSAYEKNTMSEWITLVPSTAELNKKYFACYVPWTQKMAFTGYRVNYDRATRGKGDFIVRDDFNGRPDMNLIKIVPGISFAYMFNNRGWSDVLEVREPKIHMEDLDSMMFGAKPISSADKGLLEFGRMISTAEKKHVVDSVSKSSPDRASLHLGDNTMTLVYKSPDKVAVHVDFADGRTFNTHCTIKGIPEQVKNLRRAVGA